MMSFVSQICRKVTSKMKKLTSKIIKSDLETSKKISDLENELWIESYIRYIFCYEALPMSNNMNKTDISSHAHCMWDVLPCEIIIESLARFKFQHNWVFLGFMDDITNLHLKTSRRMKTQKNFRGPNPLNFIPQPFISPLSTVYQRCI